jgi:hypothetical protein
VPLALAVVAWVTMVIAGSLGWTLVQTHHVGIKPALVRPDRPSREPDLDAPEPHAAREIHAIRDLRDLRDVPERPAAVDDLAARRARRSAVTAPLQPLLQRFPDDYPA